MPLLRKRQNADHRRNTKVHRYLRKAHHSSAGLTANALTFNFPRLKQGPYLKFTAPDGATPLLAQLKVIGSVCLNNRLMLGSYEYERQFLATRHFLSRKKEKLIRSILKKFLKPLFRPHFKKATESLQSPYNKIRQET